jgi:hypothetical protein
MANLCQILVLLLVEALVENAAAEVIRLPFHDLTDCLA